MLSEELINSVQRLMILGKGDHGRLEYILELLEKNRPLPHSDQKYLEYVISLYLGTNDPELAQRKTEHLIEGLFSDIQSLKDRLEKLERKGFRKYVGKKTIFFLLTVFVGWNALQNYIVLALSSYLPNVENQFLFPLNVLSNSFNDVSLVWTIFIVMLLAWPFIGGIHLIKFIKSRKMGSGNN